MTADDQEYERDRLYIAWRVIPREEVFYVEESMGGALYCREWGPIEDEVAAREFARGLRRALIDHVTVRPLPAPPDTGG